MSVPMRVACERDDALRDAQAAAAEYGLEIQVKIRRESNVQRDSYGSQKARPTATTVTVHALPWVKNPNRRDLERAGLDGLLEDISALATTPTKDWTDAGLTFESIDPARTTVVADGQRYQIEARAAINQFGDAALHVTLALRRGE